MRSLFDPVIDKSKLNPNFDGLRSRPSSEPMRRMMNEVYSTFDDPDGNFLEQFQSTGFNARCFELYLYAYLTRSGYAVDRTHEKPDFLVSDDGLTVALEATTVNPSTSGVLAEHGTKISDLSPDELREYIESELPMRFGSPLFSKLKERYWELKYCRGIPLVFAIQAFHDDDALVLSDTGLSRYLYGLTQTGSWSAQASLEIETAEVKEHTVGGKTIPSNFFGQADTEHVSAVLFTNSGTTTKFARMGYQHGYGCDNVLMRRVGFSFNPDPNGMDPTYFSYDLSQPPFVESWGQGLVVYHNPNCLNALPRDFFVRAVQCYVEDGVLKSDVKWWHPINSKTRILHVEGLQKKIPKVFVSRPAIAVGAISRAEFQRTCGFALDDANPISEEHGWFSDEANSFLGVIVRDKPDDDWGYVILARDERFRFRAIETELSLPSKDRARGALYLRMHELLEQPQRIFEQGD